MDTTAPAPIAHTEAPRLKFARALVFLASFCLMTIEIVAGRMTAPYLGVSLYTWTSVIGAVLLGVTLGNYAGGWMADRSSSRRNLGLSVVLAGVCALLATTLARTFGPSLGSSHWPLWLSSMLFALVVFFPAAFFLSLVSPQVVKFDLHDLEKTGVTIGTIGAWGALGSILGTFATGFIFIAFIGTQKLMWSVAIVLLVTGCLVAWQDRIWKRKATPLVALALLSELLIPPFCRLETNYYCIRIIEGQSETRQATYTMYLDHLVHSFTTPSAPDSFGYDYEQIHAGLVAYRFGQDEAFSTLTIGGGGYTMPRYLERLYPNATVEVAEIDPDVTEANHAHMELPRDTRIRSHHGDARVFLSTLSADKRYDVIFGDAVNDFAVPYQITTREFHALVKRHLNPGGFYAITVIDDPAHGRFTAALVRTLQEAFPHVYLFPMGSDMLHGVGRNTFEIVSTDTPIEAERWRATRPRVRPGATTLPAEDWERFAAALSDRELAGFLERHPVPPLTDDFAPTDNYLAPVFRDAYLR